MMVKRAWFKPKQFGIGYSPTGWEGWSVTAAFILILVGGIRTIQHYGDLPPGLLRAFLILVWIAVAGGVFFLIARSRTVGEVRWRWGDRT